MNGLILLTASNAVATAMETALGTVASDALGAIASVVPVAAPILGAGIVIAAVIKGFKKITGR